MVEYAPEGKNPPTETRDRSKQQEIVNALTSFYNEAENNRRAGPNPRDDKWRQNLDLYWNRYDFSNKAAWQAMEVMPEVPTFVDRFAAALKQALVSTPEGFYTVQDPNDLDDDVAWAIKEMTDSWLSRCGKSQTSGPLAFPAVFEEQIKLGALMACCSVVGWKPDPPYGRVSIETVNPMNVWLDHTGRSLYRIRRIELDRHELGQMAAAVDGKGYPLFDLEELQSFVGYLDWDAESKRTKLTGSGASTTSPRVPIVLDEYLATVLNTNGTVMYDRALCVVANGRYLLRGPETNPFWHGQDWLSFVPLITVPLSPYGRSYMEDFGSIAKTFTELTNLILDAVHTSAIKAYVAVPSMLINPGQLAGGITPNLLLKAEEGVDPRLVLHAVDLGNLPQEAVTVWQAMKQELREAAMMNEIGMGQFAPKGRTSATEISSTESNSTAILRSVAQTVETRWLDPNLDLVWKTGLQHVRKGDKAMESALGKEMFNALLMHRKELIKRPVTFQARGISTLMQKAQKLRAVMNVMQILASNQLLLQEFLKVADMRRLVTLLFDLSEINIRKLQTSERERLIAQVAQPMEIAMQQAAQGGGQAPPGAANEAQDMAAAMGVARA